MEKQEDPIELIPEERKIPVFTVLKNNAILKNIYLLDNHPALVGEPNKEELEEILLVGRHPDCNITLEHPSISRFHLRVHSNPSSQSLSVVDLSSVHGTWISGKKIEPGVQVKLQEGDTIQLGGSSRLYRLHWIPLSRAYDLDNPFVPPIQESDPVKEGEEEKHQVEDGFLHEHDETLTKNDTEVLTNEERVECKTTYKRIHEDDEINNQQASNYQLDKENSIPESSFAQTLSQAELATENAAGSTPLRSQQKSALRIWSRSGNISSVLIQTDKSAKKSSRVSFDSEIKSEYNADTDTDIQSFSKDSFGSRVSFGSEIKSKYNADVDTDIQSFSKDIFLSGDMDEKMLTPDKENCTTSSLPLGSLKTDEFDLESGSATKFSLPNADEVDDELVALDKENVTTNIHLLSADTDEEVFTPHKQLLTPNKENQTSGFVPLGSLEKTDEFDSTSGSATKSLLLKADEVDDGIVTLDKENVRLLSANTDEEVFTPHKQLLTPYKENQTPSSVSLRSLFDLKSGSTMKSSVDEVDDEMVDEDDKIVIPDKNDVTLNILPLSGSMDEEEMFTTDRENPTPSSFLLRSLKNTDEFDLKSGSTIKSSPPNVQEVDDEDNNMIVNVHFLTGDMDEEEMFAPGKETYIPSSVLLSSLKKTGEVDSSQSTTESSIPNMDEGDDETVTPNEGNVAVDTHLRRSIKQKGKSENPMKMKVLRPSPLKIAVDPRFHRDNSMPFSFEKNNCDERDDGIFTPHKENMTPNTHFLWSMSKIGKPSESNNHTGKVNENDSPWSINKIGELEETSNLKCIISAEKEHHNEKVLQENHNEQGQGLNLQSTWKGKTDRVPFQSVLVNSNSKSGSNYSTHEVSTKSIHHIKYLGAGKEHIVREKNKRWCMVVDTTTLLNKESRKALQLLQGLKWTTLVIPHIVIRELDCMKRHASFFRRTTEVTSALEWVEDCMINTKWWIHVQCSDEEATPPTTRTSLFGGDSLLDILSPKPEDHILEYVISLRKTNNGQQFVLLSDDVTLKIKSMAEGLLCETATDFRESLVNPFSERFLWTDSSPRGTTWSYVDDVVRKETSYYHCPLKKSSKFGESPWGLKIILLHNSRYRKFSSLNKN